MIVLALVVVLVGAWVVMRRRRRAVLAGRVAEKPTYSVLPPTRRLGNLGRQRL